MLPDAHLRQYFLKLGLEPEIAELYLALHHHGPQTISELSRTSGIERTRIYRLADELAQSGLFEIESHYKRTVYRAAPITSLQVLISQKEQSLLSLRSEYKIITQQFLGQSLSSPTTRVNFFRGSEGTRQMLWNETKSQTEVLSVLYENMQINTKAAFFERWVRTCNERGLHFRGLVGDRFLASQKEWYAAHHNEQLAHWQARYVNAGLLPITHNVVIYDDVLAHYQWSNNEIFGIEIHNQDIADSQRGFFELAWQQADTI